GGDHVVKARPGDRGDVADADQPAVGHDAEPTHPEAGLQVLEDCGQRGDVCGVCRRTRGARLGCRPRCTTGRSPPGVDPSSGPGRTRTPATGTAPRGGWRPRRTWRSGRSTPAADP